MRSVVDMLAALARTAAGKPFGAVSVLAARRETVVVRVANVVAKAHAPDADAALLAARLSLAASPALAEIVLAPLRPEPVVLEGGRLATLWPAGERVRTAIPWTEAGRLLAALHDVEDPGARALPGCGAGARWLRAVARLETLASRDGAAAQHASAVRAASATLPAWIQEQAANPLPASQTTPVHGDWHLGQLVRVAFASGAAWRLIDVDDLGVGDPAWDLARTAAFFAVGLLAREDWESFVTSYRDSGGRALRAAGDPWQAIDVHARALTIQCAAAAIVRAHESGRALDESELRLVEGCRRIARL